MNNTPTIMIVGVSSGLGRSLALQLVSQCHHVTLVGRHEDSLNDLRQSLADRPTSQAWPHTPNLNPSPPEALIIAADLVRDPSAAYRLPTLLSERQLSLSALVVTAVYAPPTTPSDLLDQPEWDQTFAVNTRLPLMLLRALSGPLRQPPHTRVVVPVCRITEPYNSALIASKQSMEQQLRCYANEISGIAPVSVHLFDPGPMNTPSAKRLNRLKANQYPNADEAARSLATLLKSPVSESTNLTENVSSLE